MENNKGYGTVIASTLYVRDGVGKEYNPIRSIPTINYGDKVEILDTIIGTDNEDWYHIRINNEVYGYVKAEFIKKI